MEKYKLLSLIELVMIVILLIVILLVVISKKINYYGIYHANQWSSVYSEANIVLNEDGSCTFNVMDKYSCSYKKNGNNRIIFEYKSYGVNGLAISESLEKCNNSLFQFGDDYKNKSCEEISKKVEATITKNGLLYDESKLFDKVE